MAKANEPLRFRARVYRVGANYCVDVPARVSHALGSGTHVPVAGSADGHPFRSTMVPRGGGRHRLFLNGEVRAAAGAGAGDRVTVELAPDAAPREPPALPDDLAAALRAAALSGAFAALTVTQRRSMIDFIERAKRPQTRARYIERLIAVVGERPR